MNRSIYWGIIVSSVVMGVSSAANATYLQCSEFHQSYGYAGTNPPVTATIMHSDIGGWTVTYTLKSGMLVNRSAQFGMTELASRIWTVG